MGSPLSSFTVPVTADDFGGFAITYSFAVYNHFEASAVNIQVPYPSSQLEIETLTFRDKLKPGTDETWSFKIKGPKGDKVAAELLANMYDASLDSFRGHYWGFNPLVRPTYYTNRTANAHNCFTTSSFSTYLDNQTYGYTSLYFDSFNWFGLHFGYGGNYGYGHAKKAILDLILEDFKEAREKFDYYMNHRDELESILAIGASKANVVSDEVIDRVRAKVGY